MKDLGQKLYNERRYDFSRVYIQQILFKCTGQEVLLNCKIIFNQVNYTGTLCLTFPQFNDLLMRSNDRELKLEIPSLIGEALSMPDQNKFETSFQINLMKIFGRPLRIRGCTYHTSLVVLPIEELAENPDNAYVFLVKKMTFQPALK